MTIAEETARKITAWNVATITRWNVATMVTVTGGGAIDAVDTDAAACACKQTKYKTESKIGKGERAICRRSPFLDSLALP